MIKGIKNFLAAGGGETELSHIIEKFFQVSDSARTLFTQSEDLKKLVTNVKESIERSSTASHQISATIATTAQAASDLESTARESYLAMERSAEARQASSKMMEKVVEAVNELEQSVKSGLGEISTIAETMLKIQEKAKVINEIVFQTKLLSFNASVEAARAGEYGKGFSVVAEEMGKLASLSGNASKEIEQIIVFGINKTREQIGSVSKKMNEATEKTNASILQVNAKRSEVTALYSNLNTGAQKTNEKAQQISTATREQDLGVKDINSVLAILETSSTELENMAQSNHRASIHLSEVVNGLMTELEKFAKSRGVKIHKPHSTFDFDAAIKAHIDWKMKLGKYLEKPDGSLDENKVCLDNACVLGKWLYAEGQQFKEMDQNLFEAVRGSHAHFHQIAGRIVGYINQGQVDQAAKLLAPKGEYVVVSDKTVALIRQLKNKEQDLKNDTKIAS